MHVRVKVVSPSREQALALLSTVRQVEVDTAGCRSMRLLVGAAPADQATDQLVPGETTGGRICLYGKGWMERSHALSDAEAADLVRSSTVCRRGGRRRAAA